MPRRAFFVRATRRCARGTTVDPSAPLANQSPSYALRVALVGSAVGLATPLYVVTLLLPSSRLHRPMPKRATVAGEWHLCGLLATSAPPSDALHSSNRSARFSYLCAVRLREGRGFSVDATERRCRLPTRIDQRSRQWSALWCPRWRRRDRKADDICYSRPCAATHPPNHPPTYPPTYLPTYMPTQQTSGRRSRIGTGSQPGFLAPW